MKDDFNFNTGMPSPEMAQYLQMFVDETSEQLDGLEKILLLLENNPTSQSDLNEAFRLIHSIKGASAMMGLESISVLAHLLEEHFERLRSGVRVLDEDLMDLILQCIDFLRKSTDKLRAGQPLASDPELLEELSRMTASSASTPAVDSRATPAVPPAAPQTPKKQAEPPPPSQPQPESATELISAAEPKYKRLIAYFERDIELPELRAELVIARIAERAEILRQSPPPSDLSRIIELGTLQLWIRTVRSDVDLRAAANIVGVEVLEIEPYDPDADWERSASTGSAASVPEPKASRETETTASRADSGEVAPQASSIPRRAPEETQSTVADSRNSKVVETVRVDIQRLDRLMNLAGELVVNRARLVQLSAQMNESFKKSGLHSHLRELCDALRQALRTSAQTTGTQDATRELQAQVEAIEQQLQVLEQGRRSFAQLNEAIDQLNRVAVALQRGVRETRMLPIGPLFNRFQRTVRDISAELAKKVHLELKGEHTELDKRMIDELGDPLVHLVRNAIDHGLESEAERRLSGKSEVGTLTLEAAHSGNSVLIYVRDDGGGINAEKVRARAIERGLITRSAAAEMTERELAQFIWHPGFSTADSVSDLSGRGVGMDIVKTRIAELSGTVEVDSKQGVGTTFTIRLPLTLAIIHGLLFRARHGIFAAPIENVREIVSVKRSEIFSVQGRESIEVRGQFIPLVDIDEIFQWHRTPYQYPGSSIERTIVDPNRLEVVILSAVNRVMGLTAWELCGGQDIVIKSLAENFVHLRGLAGASILGDGSVCLLLDVAATIELGMGRLKQQRPVAAVGAYH